jgi:hypothetical protein
MDDVMAVGIARKYGQRSEKSSNAPESNLHKNSREGLRKSLQNAGCSPFQGASNAITPRSITAAMAKHGGLAQGDCLVKFKN